MRYHPDSVIDEEIARDAAAADIADVMAGYPPRRWQCDCGADHVRGYFLTLGTHRCLGCGYVGAGGTLDEGGAR